MTEGQPKIPQGASPLLRYTFGKEQHLCLRAEIENLFSAGGKSFSVYPIRVVYKLVPRKEDVPVKVLISVSKKRLRHAVDRNRAKRQIRESYRLQKHILLAEVPEEFQLHVGFIFLASQPMKSDVLKKSIHSILQRMAEALAAKKSNHN